VPSDTHPAAAEVQLKLLREAGPTRRFQIARALTRQVVELSRAALRRRHPSANEREIDLLFVEFHYGKAAADMVRRQRQR